MKRQLIYFICETSPNISSGQTPSLPPSQLGRSFIFTRAPNLAYKLFAGLTTLKKNYTLYFKIFPKGFPSLGNFDHGLHNVHLFHSLSKPDLFCLGSTGANAVPHDLEWSLCFMTLTYPHTTKICH